MNLLEIKHDRLSEPERFLLGVFDGIEDFDDITHPDVFFYKKGDHVMFEYDSKIQELWYSYEHIRVVFREKFKLNLLDSNEMIQSMVEEYLKLNVMSIGFTLVNIKKFV